MVLMRGRGGGRFGVGRRGRRLTFLGMGGFVVYGAWWFVGEV